MKTTAELKITSTEQQVEEIPFQYRELVVFIQQNISDLLEATTVYANDAANRAFIEEVVRDRMRAMFFRTTQLQGYDVVCDERNNPKVDDHDKVRMMLRLNLIFSDDFGVYLDFAFQGK